MLLYRNGYSLSIGLDTVSLGGIIKISCTARFILGQATTGRCVSRVRESHRINSSPHKAEEAGKKSTSGVLILNQLCSFRAESYRGRILSRLLGLVSDNPCTARIPWLKKEW